MTVATRGISCYLLPGRSTHPADALAQARDAEALGFERLWISERLDLKEIGVLVGASIASTSRIGIGVGITHLGTRNLMTLAALAATAQSVSGGRFALGVGRGMPGMSKRLGIRPPTLAGLAAFPPILNDLWTGERVIHHGELGDIERARFTDLPEELLPHMFLATIGEKGFEVAARCYDGVILNPLLSAEAVGECVATLRQLERTTERRSPLRIVATVLTSPDLEDSITDEIVRARALTYLQMDGLGEGLVRHNGWAADDLVSLRNALDQGARRFVDMSMTRRELASIASLVPDGWVEDSCAVGTAQACAARLDEYWAAGADEVLVHGALPGQCGGLMAELRRTVAP